MTTPVLEGKASFALRGHNPDVLTCIANLSNDEVFTPPELASQMLDTVADAWADANGGEVIWQNPDVTFLDPFTKSGVFLREITARLTEGLADAIPDLKERVDHILTKQVYGIGITQLTALLARRSVYCSKDATGSHSIAKSFDRDWGNIWFERTEHTWAGGRRRHDLLDAEGRLAIVDRRCRFCGAAEAEYARSSSLETHAYAFIHTDDIKARVNELFGADMQFDVIIGNPPYQLGSDGGTRDVPIYQHFVEQAKRLQPRLLSMVIQSRWMSSGLGLTSFRRTMLSDRQLRVLVDFPVSDDVFPDTGFRGGVCYFLRDASYNGECMVTTVRGSEAYGPVLRDLDEYDVFVRDVRATSVLRKVLSHSEQSITSIFSADKEFGWTSNFDGLHAEEAPGDVPVYYVRKRVRSVGYIPRSEVTKSAHLVDTWKVLVPKAGSGGDVVPDYVLGRTAIAPSPSACTQTFLFAYVDSHEHAKSVQSYLSTRFVRFLISLRKITQDATRATYTWVPIQDWNRWWSDEDLYAKYGLSEDEVAFLESQIKPIVLDDEDTDV